MDSTPEKTFKNGQEGAYFGSRRTHPCDLAGSCNSPSRSAPALSRRDFLKIVAAAQCAGALASLTGCEMPFGQQSSGSSSSRGAASPVSAEPHNLASMASNQWYSSVYQQFPSEPLFALPAAFQLTSRGLGVGLPEVRKSPDTIFASYAPDLTVGFVVPCARQRITALGDWSIGLTLEASSAQSLSFTLAHGAPFTMIHVRGGALVISAEAPMEVYSQNTTRLADGKTAQTTDARVTIHNHDYLLHFGQPARVSLRQNTLEISGLERVFLAALDQRQRYETFKQTAGVEIVGTQAQFSLSNGTLETTYSYATTGGAPLIALYPHHQAALAKGAGDVTQIGTYASIRGPLTLIRANTFATREPAPEPDAAFAPLSTTPPDLLSTLRTEIASALKTPEPASRDYYLGVWFGDLDNLLLLAHALGLQDEAQRLQEYMQPKFAQSLQGFVYDHKLHSVIATAPEFGNQQLNDHHFHYGYYIRTAAALCMLDPSYLPKIRDEVDLLVGDIATADRRSARFPYLRTFDTYEGHSWASGYEQFQDGNNQESSSEAIQAWYAVYLWGQVTGDTALTHLGLSLYTLEARSTRYYWFGQNRLYTAPYQHAIASIVWGGKVDFATWFSAQTNMKYGIQILPVTPGSTYLGRLPSFTPYAEDYAQHGGNVMQPWGDLFVVWRSFYEPQAGMALKDKLPASAFHLPRSVFLYMLYHNNARAQKTG